MKKSQLKKIISMVLVFALISTSFLWTLTSYATDNYTVDTNTINTNANLAELGTSLLAGRDPISEMSYYGIDQLNDPGYGDPEYTTDGDIETQANCVIYDAFHYYDPNPIGYPQRGTLVFDCQQSSVIDEIFLSFRDGTKMAEYQILISDNEYGDVFTSAQVVIDYENTTGNQLFTFITSVVGRYIIIKGIDSDAPYFYEFAAYGSAAGSHDSFKTQLTQTQANSLGTAINKNSVPYSVFDYNGDVGSPGEDEVHMTDGDLTSRSFYSPMYYDGSIADTGSITYYLGEGAETEKVLIATDNLSGCPISSYEIYIGTDYDTLYTGDNKILAYDNVYSTTNQLFVFGTAKTGEFFGIRIIDPSTGEDTYARVHEISLFGTAGIATYYVDSASGDDSNGGISSNAPFETIAKVNTIQLRPGDQVLFKAGGSWEGVITLNASGTSSSQIVFGRYGTGADPIIDAKRVQCYTFIATDKEYFTVENLQLKNTSEVYATGNVVRVELRAQGNLNHIRISNITITGPDGNDEQYSNQSIYFILFESAYPYHFNDVVVSGCVITDIWGSGIVFEKASEGETEYQDSPTSWSTDVIIENNYIDNTGINGIVMGLCNGVIIQHNTVANAGQMQTGQAHEDDMWLCGAWVFWCQDAVIQFNEVYGTALGAGDGSAFDTDWGNAGTIIHQYNYSHDNAGGFKIGPIKEDSPLLEADIIRYNISENDGSTRTLMVDADVSKIYNNVFYNPNDPIQIIKVSSTDNTGSEVKNNIFVGNGSSNYTPDTNVLYDYNVFYGHSGPNDSHKLISDPKFVNPGYCTDGYRLKADSPCIDSGISVTDAGSYDYFGTALSSGAGVDRGVNEIVADENVATFFDDSSYSGNPVSLDVGTYSTSQMMAAGINNNSLSSLILQDGIQVTAYDGDISGTSWIYTSNTSSFTSGDDMISSMAISKTASYPGTLGKSAIFYSDSYSSNPVNVVPGSYKLSQLQALGITDNTVSSVRVTPGIKVRIYTGDSFSGTSLNLYTDTSLVYSSFNNTMTSVVVSYDLTKDLAAFNTGSADSSADSNSLPANAFDDELSTKWCSAAGSSPHYISLDFGSTYNINRWVVYHAGNYESSIYNTKDFKLQVSANGTDWIDVDTVTGNTANITDRTIVSTSATYVRMYITVPAQNANEQARICEFKVYATDDNMALKATVSADSYSVYESSYAADNLINTKWCSAGGSPHYLTLDFGSVYNINRWVVYHAGNAEDPIYNTKNFKLQTSIDGSTWTDVDTVTDNTYNITDRNISVTFARYARLYITTPAQNEDTQARICEFKVFGPSNLATNSTSSADSDGGVPYTSVSTIDNNITTKWCSATGADHYVAFDLKTSYSINHWTVVHAGINENVIYNTKNFKLQVSPDGTNWTDVDTVTNNSDTVTSRAITAVVARYVRLYITTPAQNADTQARIYEFSVSAAT